MSLDPSRPERGDLAQALELAAHAAGGLLAKAREQVAARVRVDGALSPQRLAGEQHAVHGLAWLATYAQAMRQLGAYAHRMDGEKRLGEAEELTLRIAAGEFLSQIASAIAMSQGEYVRPVDMGLDATDLATFVDEPVGNLIASGSTPETRARLVELMIAEGPGPVGDPGLDDTLEAMRLEMRRFAEAEVVPHAHAWHLANDYIPMELITQLAELGVFGLTIPEDYGGLGLGKKSMCVVSEELSRGWIAVGSLGTRSEIAAELILAGGTDEQKSRWLPHIASGVTLPTAVFTEPDTGSDLASLRTRAVRDGGSYRITGQKTWITHAARADLMTLLARSDPDDPGYSGLSMFLAEKPRGTASDPFPAPGMSGSEIEVLGYRGMKEFDISFDGFAVPADALLGSEEGQGFKQLMQTFEAARIQTAARAVGVAQSAMELGLKYAMERRQFGTSIVAFPRVSDKLALMAAEIMVARQLTYFAASEKDQGRRCDMEAGMAKLLAARAAWAAADNAVQIHGGNGFALEFPASRILCDARILSIFEGAAEIQAQLIARRLLEHRN